MGGRSGMGEMVFGFYMLRTERAGNSQEFIIY